MAKSMNLNVRVSGALKDFVAGEVGADGAYENVSEYVRDLIRRDMALARDRAYEQLKAELQLAFAAPREEFAAVDADEVINRNRHLLPDG